jgi:hypothetical protein
VLVHEPARERQAIARASRAADEMRRARLVVSSASDK